MCAKLDKISPSTAPHKHYVAFRYVEPLTESTFEQVQKYVLLINFEHHVSLYIFLGMVPTELCCFHNILNTVVLLVVQVLMPFIHTSKISKLPIHKSFNNFVLNKYSVLERFQKI